MSRIRVVVADQAEAIFYDMSSLKTRPIEVDRLSDRTTLRPNPEPSAQPGRPGHSYESVGGQRYALRGDEPHDLRRQQAVSFARTVAEKLDTDRRDRGFQQLIVVASAPFRSLLRSQLTAAIKACIVYEVPKDLVHSHIEALRDYLPDSAQELKSA